MIHEQRGYMNDTDEFDINIFDIHTIEEWTEILDSPDIELPDDIDTIDKFEEWLNSLDI